LELSLGVGSSVGGKGEHDVLHFFQGARKFFNMAFAAYRRKRKKREGRLADEMGYIDFIEGGKRNLDRFASTT